MSGPFGHVITAVMNLNSFLNLVLHIHAGDKHPSNLWMRTLVFGCCVNHNVICSKDLLAKPIRFTRTFTWCHRDAKLGFKKS